MFDMDLCYAEEIGLVLLEMHFFCAGDEPDVVEVAGVAEVEAAFLPGERGDVGAGDEGEADESEEGGQQLRCGRGRVFARRGERPRAR